jgi:YggT family protein
VLLVAIIDVAALFALHGQGLPTPLLWVRPVLTEIARTLLWTYFYAIFVYALLSLIAPGGYSPLQSVLTTLCEPVLRPIRRLLPAVAGLDLSPLWAIIGIQAILILMREF